MTTFLPPPSSPILFPVFRYEPKLQPIPILKDPSLAQLVYKEVFRFMLTVDVIEGSTQPKP
jgi:hypothetical protein